MKYCDSEQFYSTLADFYTEYSKKRRNYLKSVDNYIIDHGNLGSMIDIGSGNGERLISLARQMGCSNYTLTDNSEGMIEEARKNEIMVQYVDISSGELDIKNRYDVLTCLWNVLGHINTPDKRLTTMKNLGSLINDQGYIFIDVNNRYNILQYGIYSVVRNILYDLLFPSSLNGDFDLQIRTNNQEIKTRVHIFNPFEIKRLINQSGLKVVERIIIDYKTGKKRPSIFLGQIVYKLARI